jgi:hypothetical protein
MRPTPLIALDLCIATAIMEPKVVREYCAKTFFEEN